MPAMLHHFALAHEPLSDRDVGMGVVWLCSAAGGLASLWGFGMPLAWAWAVTACLLHGWVNGGPAAVAASLMVPALMSCAAGSVVRDVVNDHGFLTVLISAAWTSLYVGMAALYASIVKQGDRFLFPSGFMVTGGAACLLAYIAFLVLQWPLFLFMGFASVLACAGLSHWLTVMDRSDASGIENTIILNTWIMLVFVSYTECMASHVLAA